MNGGLHSAHVVHCALELVNSRRLVPPCPLCRSLHIILVVMLKVVKLGVVVRAEHTKKARVWPKMCPFGMQKPSGSSSSHDIFAWYSHHRTYLRNGVTISHNSEHQQ